MIRARLTLTALTGVALAALALSGSRSAAAEIAPACVTPPAGDAKPWLNPAYSAPCRARYVLQSLKSLDEKLDAIIGRAGAGRGAANWLSERGLPNLGGGDGPAGIRGGGVEVTSFPTPLSIAASFDPETAALYGQTLGQEFFEHGANRMGGPALDMARTWHFGRVTESFGEDPFLVASTAGPEVKAIQAQHVVAMAKHFAVYTQEQGRAGDHPLRLKPAVDEVVSERAIREIYLQGFEAAVKVGGAGAIMCAFPRINGVYACENPLTLGILKSEWGFDGAVEPDFPDAQRSIVAAINAGLDTGVMASSPPPADSAASLATATDNSFNGESLREAVKAGKVSAERVDDLILRRLVPQFRVGAFDHPAKRKPGDVSTPERRATARDLITRGAVLLKNEGGVLPLGPAVRSIAIIGEQAGPNAVVAEMGSGHVDAMHLEPVLPAVRQRAGTAVKVVYAPGTLGLDRLPLIPTGMVKGPDGQAGFRAEYAANPNFDFSGKLLAVRQEAAVNNTDLPRIPGLPDDRGWSARWSGRFTPVEDGMQRFTLAGSGTGRLFFDGKAAGQFANADFGDTVYAQVPLKAGQAVDIRVEWTPRVTFRQAAIDDYGTTLGPAVRLGWAGPDALIAEAVEAARKADVAVVFVGHKVGEGMDRLSLSLPADQDALIEAVAAANPRTVVVLQTGGAVKMPWLDQVAGVLEMWLPGDSFGPATAKLLFGDAEPAGRLPVTFPKDETQGPATRPEEYPGTPDASGAVGTARFDEELQIGYRYYDAHDQAPLFPFGYGLSYSRFEMTGGRARRLPGGGAAVKVQVRNVGSREGSEVVQVYLGFPKSAGEPPRQLKGFQKVRLMPGETRAVEIALAPEAFRHWEESSHRWAVTVGDYAVMVGRSSRDIVFTANVAMAAK